ncbi:MAG: DinB family protein [Chitinophagaceae bacterium]|nr:DinB family protein [Chitinophagaceae bacterium]
MQIIPLLLKELDHEVQVARKMLTLVPEDKFAWKPHQKSTAMRELAVHIAELPSWITMGLNTTEMDFETSPYTPTAAEHTSDLLAILERSYESGKESLNSAGKEDLLPSWTLRNGQQIYAVMTKYELIRHCLNQITHHRAQLGVYLRILDIPIPGSYGPSADEMTM